MDTEFIRLADVLTVVVAIVRAADSKKKTKEAPMNPMTIISLGLTFYNLNKGQLGAGKQILKEGTDVLQALGNALKDNKITQAEKKLVAKELKEFSNQAIKVLDALIIPE
mgnify:FL=1